MTKTQNTDGGIVSGNLVLHQLFESVNGSRVEVGLPGDLADKDAASFQLLPVKSKLLLEFYPLALEWDDRHTLYFEAQTQWVVVPFETDEEWQRFWEGLWFDPVFELTHPYFPNHIFQGYVEESPDWQGSEYRLRAKRFEF